MYLKSIEMQGFKSFAQKIDLEFHNGITGIVGPNGSGKSNVADAVRWVLGEQSAKQLRGGSMQDVIFSGTETRKPLSFASVAITLDNSDHALAVDYQEVTVTRRLYRSGESEYLLNGSACKLREINELFYDTGIGKEGYSIIGQGQIDKILSGKPEERRELFDEAAGIVKFKRRKTATIRKLEAEQANLVRVSDILSELTRQVKPLERQAETARAYLAKRDRQRLLDANVFLAESEKNEQEEKDLSQRLLNAREELDRANEEQTRTKEEYDRLEKVLTELDDNLELLRQKNQSFAIAREQAEGRIAVIKEQLQSLTQNQESTGKRLSQIETDVAVRDTEIARLSGTQEELGKKISDTLDSLHREEEALEEIRRRISTCEDSIAKGKDEIMSILDERASMKGKTQRFDTILEQIEIRKASLSQRVLTAKSEELVRSQDQEKAVRELEEVNSRILKNTEESDEVSARIETLTGQIRREGEQLEQDQAFFHRESSRLESIKNMAERYDGFGGSIRRVMERKGNVPGLHGVVADLIQVRKEYELAVETALGGAIQNIVTDTEQTAKQMIEFLKKNRYGRATFLPLDSLVRRGDFTPGEALKETGVVDLASRLVETQARYHVLVDYLLGRILVVDTIDHAIAIARKYRHSLRIVTLEGESLSPGGSMTGGAFKNSSNLLGRKREIEELERSVRQLEENLNRVQTSLGSKRDERTALRDRHTVLGEELRGQYIEQNTLQMRLKSLEEKKEKIEEEYRSIEKEKAVMREEKAKAVLDKSSVIQLLDESDRDEAELQSYILSQQEELDFLREEEKRLALALEELRIQERTASQEEEFISGSLERLTKERDLLASEREELTAYMDENRQDQIQREAEAASLAQETEHLSDQEKETKNRIDQMREEKENQSVSHKAFFEARDALMQKINLLDKEAFRLRALLEKMEEAREARINYLWEEYEITPNSAKEYRREDWTNVRQMKQELAKVKEEIRNLGPVNVGAIEEFRELSERHSFLSAQYEDLKKAEESLNAVILELDEGMRRQFAEKFKDIQQEFDKTFRELFGGGKGTLRLEEDADLLEAGIHIISQPPGKKLQNLMQLSGGEKALTAIALLFAIQNLKPSPFCLLDEIEAALDDSNVGRFAGYLNKLTKNTQFIVITHRRGTMTAADRLYGITMQEKGVSTLVSVDLVEGQLGA